jgi:hypothetical protein
MSWEKMVFPEFISSYLLPQNGRSMALRGFGVQIDKNHFLGNTKYFLSVTRN